MRGFVRVQRDVRLDDVELIAISNAAVEFAEEMGIAGVGAIHELDFEADRKSGLL